jgi:CRISPR/Cas system-associated endoribonuclease Cas2
MRSSHLVSYDIADEKRVRFKLMRDFGDHLQFSVFECPFRPSDLVRCRKALRAVIHHGDDEVIFVDLGPAGGQLRSSRSALALNLMEPFRPLIPDSYVLTAINNSMVTTADFSRSGPSVSLKPNGPKGFFPAYESRMDTVATHPPCSIIWPVIDGSWRSMYGFWLALSMQRPTITRSSSRVELWVRGVMMRPTRHALARPKPYKENGLKDSRARCHALSQLRGRNLSQNESKCVTQGRLHSGPFLGEFIGASLKDFVIVVRLPSFATFLGEFTGASLKAFDHIGRCTAEQAFPR